MKQIQGVLDKNKPIWGHLSQEYIANNISNFNHLNVLVSFQRCNAWGCSTHRVGYRIMVTRKLPVLNVIFVGQPDATTMRFIHTTYLPLPHISLSSRCVHILSAMNDFCLVSFGQLCGDVVSVNFDTKNVFLRKGNYFLTGYEDSTTGLYLIDFDKPQPLPYISHHAILTPPTPSPIPSNILSNSLHDISTKRHLVLYLHKYACIIVPSSCIQAINTGFYATWPGLTSDLFRKNIPKSTHTAKGQLHQ